MTIQQQFNSIHIYLRGNVTAQRPIKKLGLVRRKKGQQNTYKQNTKHGSIYSKKNKAIVVIGCGSP
jgi:hypothetical protein